MDKRFPIPSVAVLLLERFNQGPYITWDPCPFQIAAGALVGVGLNSL